MHLGPNPILTKFPAGKMVLLLSGAAGKMVPVLLGCIVEESALKHWALICIFPMQPNLPASQKAKMSNTYTEECGLVIYCIYILPLLQGALDTAIGTDEVS